VYDNDITIYKTKGGDWVAKRKIASDDHPKGRGPSSVEAHLDLLERESAHFAQKGAK